VSAFSEKLRAAVTERAGQACEYCRPPTLGQVARFPPDHIVPRTLGGLTTLENLALACPHCNGRKWMHTTGQDSVSGETVPLFNPRTQAWNEHFAWSSTKATELVGQTACGRATIDRLDMNHPDLVAVRVLLMDLGVFRPDAR
jgi:HNH endonuclease